MSAHLNSPHVTHIIGRPNGGGVQKMVLGLATSVALKGLRHSIICINDMSGGFLQTYADANIPVYSCLRYWPPSPSYRLRQWLKRATFPHRLRRLLRSISPDIVHFQQRYDIGLQYEAVNRLGIPWVLTLHGMTRSAGEDLEPLEVMALEMNLSQGLITAVSEAVLKDFMGDRDQQWNMNRMSVIHNGLWLPNLDAFSLKRRLFRQSLGINDHEIVFGMTSALIPLKRHDLAISAFARLLADEIPIRLVFAGDGPELKSLQKLAMVHDSAAFIHFLGWKEDISDVLSGIDVFLMPSDTEGFSMSLLEALALGVPAVATSVGGMQEALSHGGGILIPRDNLDELVSAMRAMLDSTCRAKFSREAIVVAQRFTIDRSAEQYAAAYQRLLVETQTG